jgi:hypothetical protein
MSTFNTHPCLQYMDICKYEKCVLKDLPRNICWRCIKGYVHTTCVGYQPPNHPCDRVWGVNNCKYGNNCKYKNVPQPWCLFCLYGNKHPLSCSGLKIEKKTIFILNNIIKNNKQWRPSICIYTQKDNNYISNNNNIPLLNNVNYEVENLNKIRNIFNKITEKKFNIFVEKLFNVLNDNIDNNLILQNIGYLIFEIIINNDTFIHLYVELLTVTITKIKLRKHYLKINVLYKAIIHKSEQLFNLFCDSFPVINKFNEYSIDKLMRYNKNNINFIVCLWLNEGPVTQIIIKILNYLIIIDTPVKFNYKIELFCLLLTTLKTNIYNEKYASILSKNTLKIEYFINYINLCMKNIEDFQIKIKPRVQYLIENIIS